MSFEPPTGSSSVRDAETWVRALGLGPHPEGGSFRETWRAADRTAAAALPRRFSGERSLGTAIYYLLRATERSLLHRLRADEVWHLYDGGPLILHVFGDDSTYRPLVLGRDVGAGQAPQQTVRHGCWFGAEVAPSADFALVGCTVAPGFDFEDFEFASRADLLARHPDHADIVTRLTEA